MNCKIFSYKFILFIFLFFFISTSIFCEKRKNIICTALESKNLSKVKQTLIKKGSNVNAKCYSSTYGTYYPALDYILKHWHKNVDSSAKILIDNGAIIDYKTKQGRSALHWTIAYGHYKIFKIIIDKNKIKINKNTIQSKTLFAAASKESPLFLKYFLEIGINPNTIYKNSNVTLLFEAVMMRRLKNIKLLLKYGADLNYNGINCLPITLAIDYNYYYANDKSEIDKYMAISKYLILKGANPYLKDKKGNYPMDMFKIKWDNNWPKSHKRKVMRFKKFIIKHSKKYK